MQIIKNFLFTKAVQQYDYSQHCTINNEYEQFEKPKCEKGRYLIFTHGCEPGLDAAKIFLGTVTTNIAQAIIVSIRRLVLVITFGKYNLPQLAKYLYFSRDEQDSDIYINNKEQSIPSNYIKNLGHAANLISIDNKKFITDPTFYHLQWLLYRAKTDSNYTTTDLQNIDYIVISHNHRDHLDEESLRRILEYNPNIKIIIPEGDDVKLLKKLDFQDDQIIVLPWWHQSTIGEMKITAVPVKHWTGRSGHDAYKSCANGYVMSCKENVIYYAGDTAKLDQTEIEHIAKVVYDNYKNYHNSNTIQLILPDGPNRSRSSMKSTHMSILESFQLRLSLAIELQKHEPSLEYWLSKTHMTVTHHNKYKLGPDHFNEGMIIMAEVLDILNSKKNFSDISVALKQKLADTKTPWARFCSAINPRGSKDFIYEELNEIIELCQKNNITENKLQALINEISWPKIGGSVDLHKLHDKSECFLYTKYQNTQSTLRG